MASRSMPSSGSEAVDDVPTLGLFPVSVALANCARNRDIGDI